MNTTLEPSVTSGLVTSSGTTGSVPQAFSGVRKVRATLAPGYVQYDIAHGLGTTDVVVSTRIAGKFREGGVSVVDLNTVRVSFGGTLNEPMDVVIIG